MLGMNSGQQLTSELLGNNIFGQISISFLIGFVVSVVAIIFITKRFTQWDYMVSTVVTLMSMLFIAPWVSIPFVVPLKVLMDPKVTNLRLIFMQSSCTVKLLVCVFGSIFGAFISAVIYRFSLKIVCYFSKKRKYNFDKTFLFKVFAAFNLPFLFSLIHLFVIYVFLISISS